MKLQHDSFLLAGTVALIAVIGFAADIALAEDDGSRCCSTMESRQTPGLTAQHRIAGCAIGYRCVATGGEYPDGSVWAKAECRAE